MIFNRISKATPVHWCSQIKDAPQLEMCEMSPVQSWQWVCAGSLGHSCVGGTVQSSPQEVRGSLHLAGLGYEQPSLGPNLKPQTNEQQ